LRFVAGHALSDVAHTDDLVQQIATHVRRDEDSEAVVRATEVSSDLYVRMFQEIGEAPWP
jgi:hypothetical protein